ncbi:MAG: abortive infection family protein [Armatimonadota bacterium]
MRTNADHNKAILALKRAIIATFNDSKWRELGYLTDSIEVITGHPRLLRSLQWGDEDYEGNVLEVLPWIIGNDSVKLRTTEDFVGLQQWLKENDENFYADLYDARVTVPLDEVEQAAKHFDAAELNKHAGRIRHGIKNDPEQAIGSAKEMLETTLKTVLGIEGERTDADISALLKQAREKLDLDPRTVAAEAPGREAIKRTLSSLGQIITGVAEVRNLYGTGHGRHRSRELEIAHARLVVNAAVTIATFLLEVAHERG